MTGRKITERGLYAITDCEHHSPSKVIETSEKILAAGISLLQYRHKGSDHNEVIKLGKQLVSLCHQYNTPFIMNDNPDIAETLGADGIHLGKEDGRLADVRAKYPEMLIGISCYNDLQRAIKAEKEGADYIAFGAFYPTAIKPNAVTASPETMLEAKSKLKIPVVAIGGITPENGKTLIEHGADFLAVISGLYSDPDPANKTKIYNSLF